MMIEKEIIHSLYVRVIVLFEVLSLTLRETCFIAIVCGCRVEFINALIELS